MKNKILAAASHAGELEALYQSDRKAFRNAFYEALPDFGHLPMAEFWKARLEAEPTEESLSGSRQLRLKEAMPLLYAGILAVFLIKLPQLMGIAAAELMFYEKNAGLIVFLGLLLYRKLSHRMPAPGQWLPLLAGVAISAIYINLLPNRPESHSIMLVLIHWPLLLWCLYGIVFMNFQYKDQGLRMHYIRHNGELAILLALLIIAGGIMTAITLGLFEVIDINAELFYTNYIIIPALVFVPVLASFIIRHYPFLVKRIAPFIARLFTPLVLVTLLVYLLSILLAGKNLFHDRDFLLMFNLMLLGVMAIIVFSVSEASAGERHKWNERALFMLSVVALLIDLVALSAIVYRLGEYGFTPNRVVVFGSNLLIFIHLGWIMTGLYQVSFSGRSFHELTRIISRYLPVYALWATFVVFVLPWLFALQ